MLEAISLLFGWLPAPLDSIAAGAVALIVVVAVVRLVAFVWELIPFWG